MAWLNFKNLEKIVIRFMNWVVIKYIRATRNRWFERSVSVSVWNETDQANINGRQ